MNELSDPPPYVEIGCVIFVAVSALAAAAIAAGIIRKVLVFLWT